MAQEKQSLALFVHGIGANAKDWWGSTPHTLESDPQLEHIRFEFYGYDTIRRAERPGWVPAHFYTKKLADLEAIGKDLWAQLLGLYGADRFPSIALFGHSMGGLVVEGR